MNPFLKRLADSPILLLLAINILVGLSIFRDYGLAWDEPLFYDYGEALGYAYSPREWLSGNFDIGNSFGASGDDHKTRGPAYLLLAREPVHLLEALDLDRASAWHLINFLFFQPGVYFLYRLALRWMRPSAALAAAALFSWQPLLWGHAFINPKDPPFLVFFLASVCLGFEMVDRVADEAITSRRIFSSAILPAAALGITTSIRVLGPLAGLLVLGYAIWKFRSNLTGWLVLFVVYGSVAILAALVTWPFLWENPVARFIEVLGFMSDNPTNLSVLFGGEVYRAGELPRRYMPFLLLTTLTEPVWPLFLFGLVAAYLHSSKQKARIKERQRNSADEWRSLRSSFDSGASSNRLISLSLLLLWFVLLVAYVFLLKPAMYDGLRHFLFILPPVFIFSGFAFEFLIDRLSPYWLYAGIIVALLLPGIVSSISLHPYQYTYYNSFVGGTDGAFRKYETDYWLTCYKEAVQELNRATDKPMHLYVHREAYIAAYYADARLDVRDLRGALDQVQAGDYILVNTRTNEDRRVFKDIAPIMQIGRGDAQYCVIKRIP
jgi:hypothetical protein